MKLTTKIILLALACLSLAAANEERIRWTWPGGMYYNADVPGGPKVEFGLRNDGVVVWREIMPATTNSPAEKWDGVYTNVPMTNIFFYDVGTNWTNDFQRVGTNFMAPSPKWKATIEGASKLPLYFPSNQKGTTSVWYFPFYEKNPYIMPAGTNYFLTTNLDHQEIDWSKMAKTNALKTSERP